MIDSIKCFAKVYHQTSDIVIMLQHFSNLGAYSRKVVKGGRCYDRSYDWSATTVGIHETNRTCDRRKFDRISTTYLQLSYGLS